MKPPTELTADEIKSLATWWPGGRRETIGGGRAWTERETGGMVQPRDSGTVLSEDARAALDRRQNRDYGSEGDWGESIGMT